MTPELMTSMFYVADRFGLMVALLTGGPVPELPPLPGRIHRLPVPPEV